MISMIRAAVQLCEPLVSRSDVGARLRCSADIAEVNWLMLPSAEHQRERPESLNLEKQHVNGVLEGGNHLETSAHER